MKKIAAAFTVFSFILPGVVNAQSTNPDLQLQAQALLQQVAQLQAQIAAQQGSGTNTTVAAGAINNADCPNISRVLKKGSSGDDVTRLQQFLATDPSVYPEGTVSGYFGALTEKAVQKLQVKLNIVSSGTPATTGYGMVGPKTAAAIALLCSTGASTPVGGYIQVSPISGNAPMNVNVVATVNSTNSCTGAMYLLNWGDGTSAVSIPVNSGNCQAISQTYQHTYNTGGTYQITLSSGAHQTGATITVYGNSGSVVGGTVVQSQGETFTASPTSGAAPLTVTFSGIVNGSGAGWCSSGCSNILVMGDGSQGAVPLPISKNQAQSYTLQHTYTSGGTYTATHYQGQSGSGRPIVGSPITITVTGSSNTGNGSTSSLNPPSVTPALGGNPKAVKVQFEWPYDQCNNYTLTWGDGTNSNPQSGVCASSTSLTTYENTHTYSTAGQYTITLTRGSRTDTAGINITN